MWANAEEVIDSGLVAEFPWRLLDITVEAPTVFIRGVPVGRVVAANPLPQTSLLSLILLAWIDDTQS